MSNLASRILASKNTNKDELGLDRDTNVDYITARIIILHPELRKVRINNGYELFINRDKIKPTLQNIYLLSKIDFKIETHKAYLVYNRLLEVLTPVNPAKMRISKHLYWDAEQGKLIDERDEDDII